MFIQRWRKRRHEARTGERLPRDWWGVALDFVIVVVGVYLGIAIGNWNDERKQAREEAVVLHRLDAEYAKIVGELEELHTRSEYIQENLEAFTEVLRGETPPPEPEKLLVLYSATVSATFPPPRSSVYTELQSSGRLGLIEDDTIRTALTNYHAKIENNQVWYDLYVSHFGPDSVLATLDGSKVPQLGSDAQISSELLATLSERTGYYVNLFILQGVQSMTLSHMIDDARAVRAAIAADGD